jgi:hypothetical protein
MSVMRKLHSHIGCVLLLLAGLLALSVPTLLASGGATQSAVLFDCEPQTPYMSYTLTYADAVPYVNGNDQGFVGTTDFKFNSQSHSISYFEVSIRYNEELLEIPTLVFNQSPYYTFPASWTLTPNTSIPGWVFFKGQWDPNNQEGLTFDGVTSILGMTFKTKCQISYWNEVVMRDTVKNSVTRVNVATYGGVPYAVCTKTNSIYHIDQLYYQVCTKKPGTYYCDTSFVGKQDVKMPVYLDCNYPTNRYHVRLEFPTQYLDLLASPVSLENATGGTNWGNYTVTTGSNYVDVVCTSNIYATGYDTLFTVHFNIKNNLTPPLSITPTITQFSSWREENSVVCYGDAVGMYYVGPFQSFCIPTLSATFKTVSKTIPGTPTAARRDTLVVQLKDNFPIGNQSAGVNVLSYALRKPTSCYTFEPTQKNMVVYSGIGTSYWETAPHYKQVDGIGTLEEDGIIRRESPSALYPTRGVMSSFQLVDSIIVDPAEVANCSAPVRLFADRSVAYDNNEYHIDTYVRPDNVNYAIYADTLDPNSPVKFESGTFTVYTYIPPTSCPYLFAWDGSRYVEENTILKAAEPSALAKPAPDYLKLKTSIPLVDGVYRLQLREQEMEQTEIDALQMTVVDRPASGLVSVSPNGAINVCGEELLPVSAVDDFGNDQLAKIVDEDGQFFAADESGTLTMTFLPGKNFDWNIPTLSLGQTPTWPPICRLPDPRIGKRTTAGTTDEFYVEVLSPSGDWVTLQSPTIRANAGDMTPAISPKEFAVEGKITIRHRWVGSYYTDKASLFLPTKDPWTRTDLALASANHSADGNILSLLTDADDQIASLIPGQTIDLAFDASQMKPVQPGYVREFVFSAKGYYTTYSGPANLPQVYQLQQNYPNPFNPTTAISYVLPKATDVTLVVYNTLGQKVKTLVATSQTAGEHSVEWDGTDDTGSPVASGVYLYKLSSPDYSSTRKMMLIK